MMLIGLTPKHTDGAWQQPYSPAFPIEAQAQYDSLLAAYQGFQENEELSDPMNALNDAFVLRRLRELPRSQRWWTDLAELQVGVLKHRSLSDMRGNLNGWRRRLREVIGESRYKAYTASAANLSDTSVSEDVIREDLINCIRTVYYFYGASGESAKARKHYISEMLRCAAAIVLSIIAVLVLVTRFFPFNLSYLFSYDNQWVVIAGLTSIAGVAGSVVSALRRLEDSNVVADPYYRYIQLEGEGWQGAFSPPFLGAVFGVVVYLAMASNLIAVANVQKTDVLQFAPLVVLVGFASGFAESLVPDVISRISARAVKSVDRPE